MQARHWRLLAPGCFDHRAWSGEIVVYVHATGETHALDGLASTVLAALIRAPGSQVDADGPLGWLDPDAEAGEVPTPDERAQLQAVFCTLERLGLVERVDVLNGR